jgi:processive 1,2-diacylglycerol beta-glucosyltransferase
MIESMPNHSTRKPQILILTVSHGASHWRSGEALRKAFLEIQPELSVEMVDGLEHCAPWFRAYYNSYLIPLKYWPALWGWIEGLQHQAKATGPGWLYRRGAQPLFQFIRGFNPDVVIATEVGMCEVAAMLKRETRARFYLVASCGMDMDRAWIQPEADLYLLPPGEVAAQLKAVGAPEDRVLPCGMPLDPAFSSLPDQQTARVRLGIEPAIPMLLVLFGGVGFGKPHRLLPQLRKVQHPLQQVFITGKNRRLEEEIRPYCQHRRHCRVYGWVENIHEWMAAADLMLGKPGGATVNEAINAGLPLVAFDPLPGIERRLCDLIEKWQVGYWARRAEEIAPLLDRLLADPSELARLRANALAKARPQAARQAAAAIMNDWQARR